MESHAPGSARPTLDRSISRIAQGAFELGELNLARSRLRSPRWRLHAVLASVSAAKRLGLSTKRLEHEARSCLDSLLASRRALNEVKPVVRGLFQGWLEAPASCRCTTLQELVAALAEAGHRVPFHCVRVLLATGLAKQARAFAADWRDPVIRYRLERLTATGLWGQGAGRRFVGQPFDEDFPPTLARFVAMTNLSHPEAPRPDAWRTQAETLLARLSRADRQAALVHWVVVAYHAGGFAAGGQAVRAIRYRSCRQLAWLRLLAASLAAGRLDDAWRALGRIEAGAHHERGRLLLARDLVRRGGQRRSLRLLSAPFEAPRLEERALLLCAMEPGRLRSTWPRWRDAAARASEDLAALEPRVPNLEHRWTLLALRAACERGLPEDSGLSEGSRRLLAHTLGIPGRCFRALARDRVAVRCWLGQVEAGPHPLKTVLHVFRWLAPAAVEPIWSEYVSLRASRLGPARGERLDRRQAEAFARGLDASSGVVKAGAAAARSAISAERCAEDEGVSWSLHAEGRRRVILGAVKHSLRIWLAEGAEPPPAALRSRLRTLSNLGGSLGVGQLVRALEAARRPSAAYRQAFATLTSLAPARAAGLIFSQRPDLLLERPKWAREMVLGLEDHGVVEPGLNRPWCRFLERVREGLGPGRGAVWLRQLMAAWPGAPRAVPTVSAVECCASELDGSWPATGDELIARVRRHLHALRRTPTLRLPAALLADPVAVKRLLWLQPGVTARGRRVDSSAWTRDLTTLRDELGEVDLPTVLRLARRLASSSARPLARRLLAGSYPLANAPRVVGLPGKINGAHYRLRYLDKRADFFTFLRLADCVPCCFDSASAWYRTHGMGWWVLALWKDPLSFCFHVERIGVGGDWRPRGFVFGGYSLGSSDPALLLNGIYLRRQEAWLRAAILRQIEETFCRPLGILRIAIANCHGGYGKLPESYVRRASGIHRLRALRSKEGPASAVYDDISRSVNRTLYPSHLYWRCLPA
ncbi:MAG: hypothetical protein AAF657_08040 [Acidobacteriota bacterium]